VERNRGSNVLLGYLAIVLLCLPACGSGDEGPSESSSINVVQKPKFAEVYPHSPVGSSSDMGLNTIVGDYVFLAYSRVHESLAQEIAPVVSAMNQFAVELVGTAYRIHGLVLVENQGDLPLEMHGKNWVGVDGISCLVRQTAEESLPFEDEFLSYMVFPFLIHENVDIGIKAECLGGRLTVESLSCRWFVEGISEFVACEAVKNFPQKNALSLLKKNYLKGLSQAPMISLNIGDQEAWWPQLSAGSPGDVIYSYAAAHYVVWKVSSTAGTSWISQTLKGIESEGAKNKATSADFVRIAAPVVGEDLTLFIRSVDMQEVHRFTNSIPVP